ncbi:AMP-binding protein [Nocardia altamirensis]|uniref:AMP-binding protein n=1 Tax=Nocardia altamirensis TaxID=472158 RepID=UPI00114CC00A|nr:AMP-binding protein [Nocardia altamirensis]
MTAEDRRRVLGEWSTGVELSEVPGIAELIRRGRSIPGMRTAIRYGAETRTYGELFGQLDRVAPHATTHGALVDQLIRSTPLLGNRDVAGSAMHAVIAAGHAVVGAGQAVVNAVHAVVGVGHPTSGTRPATAGFALAAAIADRRAVAAEQRCRPIDPALRAADVRLLAAAWNATDTTVELLAALADGATLIVATPAQLADPTALVELIEAYRVTHVVATPATVARIAADAGMLPTVRRWDVTGTATTPGLSARLQAVSAGSVTTICYTAPVYAGAVARGPLDDTGRTRPIPGARALVLDEALMPVPPNVVGDIYIGGAALDVENSDAAHRFVDDPFEPAARLFRTGDRASWTPEGWLVVAEALRFAVA